MEKTQLGNLMTELTELRNNEGYIRNRYKEIAMQLLKDHFNGDCTFLTKEDKEDDIYDMCPTIMSISMVKDSDPIDCYVTRMRVDNENKVRLDLYAYYSGETAHNVNAEWESPLDWGEVADCLIAAAV